MTPPWRPRQRTVKRWPVCARNQNAEPVEISHLWRYECPVPAWIKCDCMCDVSSAASPIDLPRVSAAVARVFVILWHRRMHQPECADPTVACRCTTDTTCVYWCGVCGAKLCIDFLILCTVSESQAESCVRKWWDEKWRCMSWHQSSQLTVLSWNVRVMPVVYIML